VQHAVGTYLHWVQQHPRLHHFLGSGSPSPVLTGARNLLANRLADLFALALRRAGADTATARPMAFGVLGLVDGVVNAWRSDTRSPVSSELLERRLTESVLALIEVNAHAFGLTITAQTPVAELLGAGEVSAAGA
jgi:AcrR family transcriptional regulator